MNHSHRMNQAIKAALNDILSLSKDDFKKRAEECSNGDIAQFFLKTKKFENFDVEKLQDINTLQSSKSMSKKLILNFSCVRLAPSLQLESGRKDDLDVNEEPNYLLAA